MLLSLHCLQLIVLILKTKNNTNFKIQKAILISPFLCEEETAKDRIKMDPMYKTIWSDDPKNG